MSIQSPVGTLDIKNATLRVGKLEVSNVQGIDTALNVTRANSVLIYDDQVSTTTFNGTTSSAGVRDTGNGYLDLAGEYVYWGQKLPNSWVMDFEMDIRSGTNAGPLYANVFSTTNTGGDGYSFVFNDSNDKITLQYDGTTLTETTVSGLFTASEDWQKVVINYERGLIAISVGGARKFYYKDIERETPYVNGEYISFSSASSDGRKIRDLRIVNGEKWVYAGESNVVFTQGSVGVGVTDPTAELDVSGTVKATALEGDGSAITNISSANVGDFASNVTRIENLETSNGHIWSNLASNVTRISTLETDLDDNSSRISTVSTDLSDNSSRISTVSTDLSDNSSRITTLESGDISISGDKTFTGDIIFESNVHMNGGNVFVANTINMTVSDPIIELGSNNLNTGDLGIIMTRHGATNSNIAIVYDESDDILRMGYTLGGASDSVISLDSNALAVSVQGNLEVGTANLFVNTSTGGVGIGTDSPDSKLHIRGTGQTSQTSFDTSQTLGASIFAQSSDSVVGSGGSLVFGTHQGKFAAIKSSIQDGTSNTVGDLHFMTRDAVGDVTLTSRMTIENGGNVGIGTTSPLQPLHVRGNGQNPVIYMSDPSNNRYSSGFGTHHIGGVGQRLDFYNGDSGANGTSLSSSHIRMSIDANGNVGIGTTSPSHKLNIVATSGDAEAHIQAQGNAGDAILYFNGSAANQRKCAIIASNVAPASYCKQDLHFCMDTVSDLGDVTIADSKMVITNAGNVGIGTTSPTSKLHINPNTTNTVSPYTTGAYVYNSNTGDATVTVRVKDSSSGDPFISFDVAGEAGWSWGIDNSDGNKMKLAASWESLSTDTKMTIDTSGNVGIGTTAPGHKLDVNGTIGVSGNQLYPMIKWDVDLTGLSNTNFYPIEFTHGLTSSGDHHPVNFKIYGESLGGSDAFNENTLVGYARGGGWSDHDPMYDVHISRYAVTEHRFQGIYEGTANYMGGFVIYMRGGYAYGVITDADEVVKHTSVYTTTTGSTESTFAIKNSSGTDVSGTSAYISQLVNLAANERYAERFTYGDFNVSGNVGIGTTSPQEKLDVRGSTYIENNSIFMSGYDEGPTNNTEYSQYVGKRYNGRILAGMEIENVRTNSAGTAVSITGQYGQKLHFRAHDFALSGGAVSDRAMTIVGNSVGIGTTAPATPLEIASTRNTDTWSSGASMFNIVHNNGQGNYYGMSFGVSATHGDGVIQTFNRDSGTAQYDLRLQPNGGNVGIGTVTPGYPLHVHTSGTQWPNFFVRTTSLWGDGLSTASETGGTQYMTVGMTMFQGPHITPHAAGGDAYIRYGRAGGVSTGDWWETACRTDGSFHIAKNGTLGFGVHIENDGDVGIGTSSPGHKLDVHGGTGFDGSTTLRILNPASQYGRTQLHIVGRYENSNDVWSAEGSRNAIMFKSQSSLNSAITNRWTIQSFPNGSNNDLGFMAGTDSTPKVVFRGTNGNVGIGSTSPTVRLDVVGGNIGFDYGRAIEVSPSMASSWTNGTTKLIETGWATGDEVRFFTPGSQSATQKMVINSYGNVGIAVTDPDQKLEVRGNIKASYSDANHGMILDAGGTLRRDYGGAGAGFHFTGAAIWPTNYLGTYSARGIDFGSATYPWYNVYTSRINIHPSSTGGGQNIFTGYRTGDSYGRAQLVLSSAYSDLIIASSQANNNHGSTLSFCSYNPSNSGDYRKFVIGQGNWGTRLHMLDFGYENSSIDNPHNAINSTDVMFTLDGINKRVGIRNMNPSYTLDVSGNSRFTSELLVNRLKPYSSSYAGGYNTAAIEVREYNLEGATGGTEWSRAPRIGFHWSGRVASQLLLESTGTISCVNNPGNAYENFKAATIYGSAGSFTGQIYTTGAFYTDGNRSVIRGSYPTLYFRDTDGYSAMLHNNSNLFYVLRGGTDTETYTQVNGVWPWIFNLANNDSTCGGSLYCYGNVTAYSDIRHKRDIIKLDNSLEKVCELNGYTYTRINDGKRYTGLIAQEVLEVLPEAVTEDDKGEYAVAYGNMAGLFVEAMKELKSQLQAEKSKTATLEAQVADLLARVTAIENS